jgi:putative ABC transport system substrate-binding protein
MTVGPNFALLYRQLASYVDRILRGASPGDLPVERPTQLDLVVNLKTAKVFGLTVGQAMLSRGRSGETNNRFKQEAKSEGLLSRLRHQAALMGMPEQPGG